MTRILRLLLIAAIALPIWQPAAAQDIVMTPEDFLNQEAKPVSNKPTVANKRVAKTPAFTKESRKSNAAPKASGTTLKADPDPNLEPEEWQIQTDWYEKTASTSSSETGWTLSSFGRTTVNVVIDNANSKVYVQGFSKYFPDAWVVGNITTDQDNNGRYLVEFLSGQLYGTDENEDPHYFVGEWNGEYVNDAWFWYDTNNQILSQHIQYAEDTGNPIYNYVCEGKTENDVNGFGYHEGTVLTKIIDRPMKTLSAEEIEALGEEGDFYYDYKYPANSTVTHQGTLLDEVVVTDQLSAAHAVALMRAVYTNKNLPGPNFRGFTAEGAVESAYPVSYAAVGTLSATATRSGNTYSLSNQKWNDTYGWNIPADQQNIITDSHSYGRYTLGYSYFNPNQYRPNAEGYTLLLVEMKDEFKTSDVVASATTTSTTYRTFSSDPFENLVEFVNKTIKSVRIITEAKRTGTNVNQGTLFKIDANKINRFFLLGKGQARLNRNSNAAIGQDFCYEPYFGYYDGTYTSGWRYNDNSTDPLFYHMFEEFSPSLASGGAALSNIYKTLVTGLETGNAKTGFPVLHDCSTVPYAEAENNTGHEFKMLADGESIDKAPDVRDLLFFIPDHRLTYHENDPKRDPTTNQKFIYYNQDYAPRMDMYVIHLNPIIGEQVEIDGVKKHVYQLELNWKSNMNSFLPAEEQEFSLWRVITTADQSTNYEPVYRVNQMGEYVDAEGNVLADQDNVNLRVPVTMKGIYSLNELDYFDYIPMDPTGKQVTYVVRGQDAADPVTGKHFLSLQYSNDESYLIPGYDKNVRMTLKIDTDNYSKFDLPAQKNHYWNEIAVANNKGTSVTANFLKVGTVIEFKRWQNSTATTNPVTVATATVTSKDVAAGTITVNMTYHNQESFTGSRNSTDYNKTQFTFSYPEGNTEGEIEFDDFKFYDNFTVDVSENNHPYNYYYRAYFESAEPFDLDPDEQGNVGQSSDVYSNFRGFKVYKTTPSVDGALTIQEVLNDAHMGKTVTENYKYSITAEQSQLSELWRYEICRWAVDADVPQEFTYFGDVQNQGAEGYSSTFGRNTYKYQDNFDASEGLVTDIELEDRELKENGGAYYYVPQAVVFTKRTDNDTYGAPRVSNAIGKLDVKIVPPDKNNYPLMTTGRFRIGGAWYAYYNIYLDFNALNIPEGYELYKVRAWRKIDKSVLGEEWPSRQVRISDIDDKGWYLYEDINYGDLFNVADDDFTMCKENFTIQNRPKIGERSTMIPKPQNPGATGDPEPLFEDDIVKDDNGNNVIVDHGDLRASFGAKRLPTSENDPDASIQKLTAEFKVRAYFTRQDGNPLVGGTATGNAPRLKDETMPMPGSGFDYFIAEGSATFDSSNYNIFTGIETLNASEVVGVKYYNVAGIESDTPFQGVNIVVTRYSDGSTTTTKILK